MTDHTTLATRLPLGSDGYAGWSVPEAAAQFCVAFVAPEATATGMGGGVGTGNAPSDAVQSASIAA